MTERIFYQDAAVSTLSAKVVTTGLDDRGEFAVLDRSCFYPEGGGQPADIGMIGNAEVTDVQTINGEIRHYTAAKVNTGDYVITIDWARRFDHMQQHTGQHLLSAVFDDDLGMVTKSFHLGTERVSIDLDVPEVNGEQLKKVEQQVNALIYKQIPIETEWVTQEQAEGMKLRKKPAVDGEIRLVKIAGIDINACGGTHLSNTGELGLLKIIRTEKAKNGTRIYFLCGKRAMRHFEVLQSVADQLTKSLNVPASELPEAAEAVLTDRKNKEKQLKKISLEVLKLEAENLKAENNLIIREFNGRAFKEVQQLAKTATENNPSIYLLFVIPEERTIRVLCAKGKEARGDMKRVLGELVEARGGSVGGTENLAQGVSPLGIGMETYLSEFQNIIRGII